MNGFRFTAKKDKNNASMPVCIAECCSVLRCVGVLQCVALCCSVLQCVANVSVLHCVAVCSQRLLLYCETLPCVVNSVHKNIKNPKNTTKNIANPLLQNCKSNPVLTRTNTHSLSLFLAVSHVHSLSYTHTHTHPHTHIHTHRQHRA